MFLEKSMIWMLCTGFQAVLIVSLAKFLGAWFHPFQLMFFYCAFGAVLLTPIVLRKTPRSVWANILWKLQIFRAFLEFTGFSLSFYALHSLPLPTQTSIGFSAPVFSSLFAVWLLKERLTLHSIGAIALGLLGVVIISNPFGVQAELPALPFIACVVASAMFGLCAVLIKRMTLNTPPLCMAAIMLLFTGIISLPFALHVWQPIPLAMAWMVLVFGLLSASVQYCVSRAFLLGNVTHLAPLAYVNLIWAALIAYVVFDEIITVNTLAGSLFVVLAAFIAAKNRHLPSKRG